MKTPIPRTIRAALSSRCYRNLSDTDDPRVQALFEKAHRKEYRGCPWDGKTLFARRQQHA